MCPSGLEGIWQGEMLSKIPVNALVFKVASQQGSKCDRRNDNAGAVVSHLVVGSGDPWNIGLRDREPPSAMSEGVLLVG